MKLILTPNEVAVLVIEQIKKQYNTHNVSIIESKDWGKFELTLEVNPVGGVFQEKPVVSPIGSDLRFHTTTLPQLGSRSLVRVGPQDDEPDFSPDWDESNL